MTDAADFREPGKRGSNWGRWGSDDQRSTTDLMTPERLVTAGGLIRQGKVFELGFPSDASADPEATFDRVLAIAEDQDLQTIIDVA